jgi:hypothetical protein
MSLPRTTLATGPARVDRRTKDLIKRARPGDVAVIDHADIDRIAAEGLIRAGVAAVVNAASSFTGRYPNSGPSLIVEAGIPLVDGLSSPTCCSCASWIGACARPARRSRAWRRTPATPPRISSRRPRRSWTGW